MICCQACFREPQRERAHVLIISQAISARLTGGWYYYLSNICLVLCLLDVTPNLLVIAHVPLVANPPHQKILCDQGTYHQRSGFRPSGDCQRNDKVCHGGRGKCWRITSIETRISFLNHDVGSRAREKCRIARGLPRRGGKHYS